MYKVKIKDIQSKYTFKIFCAGADTSGIEQEIGDLSSLTTTTKTDLVSAINEVDGNTTTNATAITNLQNNKEDKSNKTTTLSSSSTNTQYPSAKCVYDSQVAQDTVIDQTKEELDYYKTIYNVLPKVNGNGENITLDNTGESILKLDTRGQCKQDSTTGKNLFSGGDNITFVKSTNMQLEKPLPAGTYTISAIVTTDDTDDTRNLIQFRSDQYGTNVTSTSIGRNTRNSTLITTTFETRYVTFFASTGIGTSEGDTATFKDAQIEAGSTATDYEEYTGGQPSPSPDFPQQIHEVSGDNTIEVVGKNIFDESSVTFTTGILDDNGQPTGSTSSKYTNNFYPVQPNTDYTISGTLATTGSYRLYYYDKNKNWISRTDGQTASPKTYTTPNNCYYVRIQVTVAITLQTGDVMLEQSSSKTDYEPYKGTDYEVNLPVENLFNINGTYTNSKCSVLVSNNELTQTNSGSYSRTMWEITNLVVGQPYTFNCNYINNSGASILMAIYDSLNNTRINDSGTITNTSGTITLTFTATETSQYIRFYSNTLDTTSTAIVKFSNIQIEQGTKANSYNAYGNSAIEYCKIGNYKDEFVKGTGSNLIPYPYATNTPFSEASLTWNDTNGLITTSGTPTAYSHLKIVDELEVKPNTNYRLFIVGSQTNIACDITSGSSTISSITTSQLNNTGVVFNTGEYTKIDIDFKRSSSNTTTSAYFYPMLVLATDTINYYEPYNSKDKWLLKKNIGKVVFDGTQQSSNFNYNTNLGTTDYSCFFWQNESVMKAPDDSTICVLSNKFIGTPSNERTSNKPNCWVNHLTTGNLGFHVPNTITTTSALVTWFASNVSTFYYGNATPYCISIPTSLQNQLNEIEKAVAKDGQTNISQNNNDAPFKIYASALMKISGE